MSNSDRAEMNDIIAYLGERADEDGRAAQAATPGPWIDAAGNARDVIVEQLCDGQGRTGDGADGHMIADIPICDEHEDRRLADAEHIARWDPARVLAEVAAIRRIIEDYRVADSALIRGNYDPDDPGWRGIRAGRDALKSVLMTYAKAAGYKPASAS